MGAPEPGVEAKALAMVSVTALRSSFFRSACMLFRATAIAGDEYVHTEQLSLRGQSLLAACAKPLLPDALQLYVLVLLPVVRQPVPALQAPGKSSISRNDQKLPECSGSAALIPPRCTFSVQI